MAEYKLISADSHVSEPPDLWATRVDQKYRDRAPRLAVDLPGKEGAYFFMKATPPPDRDWPGRRQEPGGIGRVPD
jgi:hypothetical protein